MKELFNKVVDVIDDNRAMIIKISLTILGILALGIVFYLGSDEMTISKDVDQVLNQIENRKYEQAIKIYNEKEEAFSDSKMKRFNKSLSSKVSKLLLNMGDSYISGKITKEHYMGLVNTVNTLEAVEVDIGNVVSQAERVEEMYREENIEYDVAISYINITKTLNAIRSELDKHKQEIELIYDSRKVYEEALEYQKNQEYYEAIKSYERVIQSDSNYHDKAMENKQDCIDQMYEYYIDKSVEVNKKGNYEEALQYIEYLKEYYVEDEEINELEKEYKNNLSLYTLSADDILNTISKKSGKSKESLTITSYPQMVNDEKYYYVEVYQYDELIDEVLVQAENKKVYSFKDENKDYNLEYADGYFRIGTDGNIELAITEENAQFILENKLEEKDIKFKNFEMETKDKSKKYVKNLEDFEANGKNTYYYAVVNKGLFKRKEVYMVDMYSKAVYFASEDGIKKI